MANRKIVFGSYDTDLNGPWTLASWKLSPAAHRTQMVTVPGRDGELDLSTVLTDGSPRYGSRTLTVRLERSDGTRLTRETAIETMVNWLDGWRMNIVLPDDSGHYITGRVHVAKEYNDQAHAAVTVTAVCDPWRYQNYETIISLTAGTTAQEAKLTNGGRKTVVPVIQITGEGAAVRLVYGTYTWQLSAGTYQLPDLIVPQGGVLITYSGTGDLTFTYREAVL